MKFKFSTEPLLPLAAAPSCSYSTSYSIPSGLLFIVLPAILGGMSFMLSVSTWELTCQRFPLKASIVHQVRKSSALTFLSC